MLQTYFAAINFYDILSVRRIQETTCHLVCSDQILDQGFLEHNLIQQVWSLYHKFFNITGLEFTLCKNIFLAAGMGGGSSNAAGAMHLIEKIFGLKISLRMQETIAKKIGADVSFFLMPHRQYAEDRGNIFKDIKIPVEFTYIVLIHPAIHLKTSMVFSYVKKYSSYVDKISDIEIGDNDLLEPALQSSKEYSSFYTNLFKTLKRKPFQTGSGPTMFYICASHDEALDLAQKIQRDISGKFQVMVKKLLQ